MSSAMNTIVVIGGTSGIGQSFAERWHSRGKKLIVTGRRQDRLDALATSLPGVEVYAMDVTNLEALSKHLEGLFHDHPTIDTVFVNSGIQFSSSIKDASSSTDGQIVDEITTNVIAPMTIARHVIPRLLAQTSETIFMVTGSGLGFVPLGLFPVYCSSKAAIHQYLVGIRQTLRDSNVNIIEIVPPAVRTELGDQEVVSKFPAMDLNEFADEIFDILDASEAKSLQEVAVGTAVERVATWRGSIGAILLERGLGG